ncbi:hypothetical protein LZ32DRAFT_651225 [Colletotrichum eremochloae]|nr:hypothetical protein LZ32DRAFT_651225 [Colletotrichum eremochloae]
MFPWQHHCQQYSCHQQKQGDTENGGRQPAEQHRHARQESEVPIESGRNAIPHQEVETAEFHKHVGSEGKTQLIPHRSAWLVCESTLPSLSVRQGEASSNSVVANVPTPDPPSLSHGLSANLPDLLHRKFETAEFDKHAGARRDSPSEFKTANFYKHIESEDLMDQVDEAAADLVWRTSTAPPTHDTVPLFADGCRHLKQVSHSTVAAMLPWRLSLPNKTRINTRLLVTTHNPHEVHVASILGRHRHQGRARMEQRLRRSS